MHPTVISVVVDVSVNTPSEDDDAESFACQVVSEALGSGFAWVRAQEKGMTVQSVTVREGSDVRYNGSLWDTVFNRGG